VHRIRAVSRNLQDSRYIKELADRIHSIEGRIRAAGEGDSFDALNKEASASSFQPSPTDAAQMKRPYSSISGDDPSTPDSTKQWTSEPRPIQPYQATTPRYFQNQVSNDLSLRTIRPSTAKTQETPEKSQKPAKPVGLGQDGMYIDDAVGEVDDAAFDL
jgi:hypothetical protein